MSSEDETIFTTPAALFRFFSNTKLNQALPDNIVGEGQLSPIAANFLRTVRLNLKATGGISNNNFKMTRKQPGTSDTNGMPFDQRNPFELAAEGNSREIIFPVTSDVVSLLLDTPLLYDWINEGIANYATTHPSATGFQRVLLSNTSASDVPGLGPIRFRRNYYLDGRWDDRYATVGTANDSRIGVTFSVIPVTIVGISCKYLTMQPSVIKDIWDFDFSNTSFALIGAPIRFVIAGAAASTDARPACLYKNSSKRLVLEINTFLIGARKKNLGVNVIHSISQEI